MKNYLFLLGMAITLGACVSKKKFTGVQSERDQLQERYEKLASKCEEEKKSYASAKAQMEERMDQLKTKHEKEVAELEEKNEFLRTNNTNLLDRLSDMSVITKESSESIKQSLKTLNKQSAYIQDMTSAIQRKDSMNLALVMNLKRSLSDVNDEDVTVEVKKGVVYISLSDKMLFATASARVNSSAKSVLGKIAKVLNDHNQLDVLIEGHTDNVPISNECIKDNWDLSVKRATSVARILQNEYDVDPARITAGGRSKYLPKEDNSTAEGRSVNRRTEIIVLPKLDQFFEMLAAGQK
ncbi:MAG: OmpA family protein [Saprospiraceae bacterium]|nr:OmpA family protein [Saprospiraceae bacterium]